MKSYTIAVIGGTGKSGKYLVQNLLEKGYNIKLLLRTPENFKLDDPLIEIVKGDARNYDSINTLLNNCDVVISTLGQPVGEESIFSEATRNITRSMISHGIKRYIVIAGLNVDTPFDQKSIKVKQATDWMYQNYPKTTKDRQEEYEILTQTGLDWTLVRLPLIIQTSERFATEANLEDCKGEGISATDLAEFLISQIENASYTRQSPFLYNLP
ncbi:NAD(P)H-binding protein [Chryseobacterium sp. YIM B02567]|uniref:NAD(P)H-binding protein n=2 Tax=Chryseobacterium paridis TaxID=2800328 RepID=A0ABS1FVI8_9FLAO|nr:NAD(P)H-binding protein [Chryseobacterium paridis]